MIMLMMSMQCSDMARWFDVVFDVEPKHKECPGGETIPGGFGGWMCSCWCHEVMS